MQRSRGIVMKLAATVFAGCFRRRFDRAEHHCLLVLSSLRHRPENSRRHLFRNQSAGGALVLGCASKCAPFRTLNTMVFSHLLSNVLLLLVAFDAYSAIRRRDAVGAQPAIAARRADTPVLHYGCGASGGACRFCWHSLVSRNAGAAIAPLFTAPILVIRG